MYVIAVQAIFTNLLCLGPASQSVEKLEQMIDAGMNIARLNFSHGTYDYHGGTIKNVREAAANYSKKTGIPSSLGIALDTKGPEIRTGLLEGVSTCATVQDIACL